jgi:hypothetical protein
MSTNTGLELTGSSEFSIPELVRLAGEGSLRIPKFQRSFVWDAADVRRLFDSIYRGFPIGTLLLWRREAPEGEVAFGPISFHTSHRTEALWVVDGQQRIISLFGTLAPDLSNKDERFEVYFDLSTQRFITPRRGAVPPRAVPLRVALETRRLAAWTRQHNDDLEADDFDLADALVGVIRDYRIRAYVVAEDDEMLLREVFDRVNSAGKPITRAQVFHALFASDTIPGSPAVVVEELSRLGFGSLDENRVVQSLLALRGGNVLRDFHDEFSFNDDPYDWYDRTERALSQAIKFVRSEGIPHMSLMPYTLALPVLAAFFYLHQEPQPWVLRLLARWLWRILIHGGIGQTSNLRRAVTAVNPRRLSVHDAPSEYEAVKTLLEYTPDRPPPMIPLDGFRTDAALGRLILLALASLRPLWPDGTEIDLAAEFEKHGLSTVTELIRGHRSNAATRALWPVEAPRLTGAEDPDVLRSHAIDADAADCYRRGDIAGFIRHRAAFLASLMADFVENHVEHGAPIRPPLDDLIVADLDDSD